MYTKKIPDAEKCHKEHFLRQKYGGVISDHPNF